MKAANLITNILITVAVSLLVVSCGGGGGGGVTIAPGVGITQANAEVVAATAVNSVETAQGLSSGASVLTGVSVNATPNNFNLPDFIVSQLQRVAGAPGLLTNGSITGVAFGPEVSNCTDFGGTSGTVTMSGNVSGNVSGSGSNLLSVGDTIIMVFSNCNLPDAIINGTMSMTITQVSGDLLSFTTFTLGVNVTLSSLSISDGVVVITGNGDMSMLLDENFTTGDSRMVLSGNQITATDGSNTETLTSYNFDFTGDNSANFIAIMEGTVSTTALGGSVSFVTTTNFTGNDLANNGNPLAGVLLITTNTDGSQEWLIARSNGIDVQLDIDENGDGVVDATIMTTWTELSSL